ncbi:hypothetical protein P8452_64043 [Trifolium repens]|nr:hypothetical protein P8452_64043 [Trifolium repens]
MGETIKLVNIMILFVSLLLITTVNGKCTSDSDCMSMCAASKCIKAIGREIRCLSNGLCTCETEVSEPLFVERD